MVYIYLPAPYYYLILDVTKENLLAAGFSAVPAVILVCKVWLKLDENCGRLAVVFCKVHRMSQTELKT